MATTRKSITIYPSPFSSRSPVTTSQQISGNTNPTKPSARPKPIPAAPTTSSKKASASSYHTADDGSHPPKQADPRDFRAFSIDEAKTRNIKFGVVNKVAVPQRPIEINEQIIEVARAKNAQHYFHSSLQALNKTPLVNEDMTGDAAKNLFEGLLKPVVEAKSPAAGASVEPGSGRVKKNSKEALHKQSPVTAVLSNSKSDRTSKLMPNPTVQGQSALTLKQPLSKP
ncbi:hypothetical protein RvY_17228 [Ramazzottius varieornatus]|uniref:Uncharacterized protein n=1 Tax=Ramazzottius varieornatus TaxID=947166 RepID=A0A1D1W1E5_RAMVA|nr:hypothetical protein RvY_17228 [Ramazzottius varieornatus]